MTAIQMTGGAGKSYYLDVYVTASSGSPSLSGITVSATSASGTVSNTTDSNGRCQIAVHKNIEYTVSCSKEYFVFDPTSWVITPTGEVTDVSFTCYKAPICSVTVTGTGISGRTVTCTAEGESPITGTTGTTGCVTLVLGIAEWTIEVDYPTGQGVSPASATVNATAGGTYSKSFTILDKPTVAITVDDKASAGYQNGRTITAIPTSGTAVTGTTNSSGVANLTLLAGVAYVISCDTPSGYVAPSNYPLTPVAGQTYSHTFDLRTKPTVAVTVTDSSSAGFQSGRTITATNGTDTVIGQTNASGVANLTLNGVGSYTISSDLPTGATCDPVTIVAEVGGLYTASLVLNFGFKFTMSLNSTTMRTDPTGAWSYGDDAAGLTPMANTRTSLGAVSSVGSWGFKVNKLFKKMYYATFNTDGTISKILDPDNLALDEDGNASDITTKNTMLVIPTLYMKGESGKFTLSDKSAEGTARAHTIGGHVYDNLALGVYNGYVSGSKLMSISGVLPTKLQTRATFRTQANANGTNWMLWNYWMWRLMWMMTTMAPKSSDGQRKIGQGGHAYESNTTGVTNAMGPFAGDVSGTASAMKFLLEDWWGSQYIFIDDFFGSGGTYYAGQNAIPTDDASNKVQVFNNLTSGWWYGTTINQNDLAFGIASAAGGDNAKGLCDGQYGSTSSSRLGYVGGGSGNASGGNAGPSYLYAFNDLSVSGANIGARLAFVFDN